MIAPHAVPQNILDVEFKLFGSLTVKQFSYIAGFAFAAVIFYFIFGSIPWLAWPLILVSIGLGLALALVKINQRPFDIWLTNYISAVMGSQRSIYKKTRKKVIVLDSLGDTPANADNTKTDKLSTPKAQELNLDIVVEDRRNVLDIEEAGRLRNLEDLFDENPSSLRNTFKNTITSEQTISETKPVVEKDKNNLKSIENFAMNDNKILTGDQYIKSNANATTIKRKMVNENNSEIVNGAKLLMSDRLKSSIISKRKS